MSDDRRYAADNVYGHALALIQEDMNDDTAGEFVHVDLECGFARIGEHIENEVGMHYLGFDSDPTAVQAARSRGLEVHALSSPSAEVVDTVLRLVGDRRVHSISYLDALGSAEVPSQILDLIAQLASRWSAIVVVSAPNVTHNDVAFKMALGSFTPTPSGILDRRHRFLFGAEELEAVLLASGLRVVKRNDVEVTRSDQNFPSTSTALIRGTNLNRFMSDVRAGADQNGRVQQFVWSLLPGPKVPTHATTDRTRFISVVIRTVGRRIQELSEVLLCLAAQSNQDFDVILLGHHLDVSTQIAVEQLIDDLPRSLGDKTSLHLIDHGTRATLLNVGFSLATGRYVAVLDDDDLVFAHWIEAFHRLESIHPGKILRGVGVLQDATRVAVRGRPGIRAEGTLERKFASEFSYVDHLRQNHSPLMTLAFPIGLFVHLGITFDESLTTTEDWDYLLRAAPLTAVADSREIVAIYHWWIDQASSRTDHDAEEWRLNQLAVDRKIDARPTLLAPGETRRIRQLLSVQAATDVAPTFEADSERESLIRTIAELLESNSWKITAPLRGVSNVIGRGSSVRLSDLLHLPSADLRRVIGEIQSSGSWRRSRFLRRN